MSHLVTDLFQTLDDTIAAHFGHTLKHMSLVEQIDDVHAVILDFEHIALALRKKFISADMVSFHTMCQKNCIALVVFVNVDGLLAQNSE